MIGHRARGKTTARVASGAALALLASISMLLLAAAPATALEPVNPVTVDLAGHPANSGFLVFVENNVTIRNDESEGTVAMGGDLRLQSNYNFAAGASPARPTFTAPGDSGPTYLYVGGGIRWDVEGVHANVENQGFSKVADTSTYDAFNRDNNNALVNYRIVPKGRPYNSNTFIDGRTNQQTPESIGTPVPSNLIDIPGAFAVYRGLTRQMAACPQTVQLVNPDTGQPLPDPIPSGARGRLTLTNGQTNVLRLSASDLANLSEITFTNQPTASRPLLVDVTGTTYTGNIPNLAGISGNQAPYILWNFASATSITVTGGATIEGTLYAPNATLTWIPTQNIEGNVIARNFNHGQVGRSGTVREIHDFPFATTLSCETEPEPSANLTLVKEVVNDDGGTATADDWTLSADGPTPIEGSTGDNTVTDAPVDPGDYTLAEDGPDGYETDGWTCDGGTLDGDTLTLEDGDDVTCTIVNDDTGPEPQPTTLTLVKEVVNDDGGSATAEDWTLSADGPTPIEGTTGSEAVTDAEVDPGAYGLDEDGPDGYVSIGWDCDGGLQIGANVLLSEGDNVTCTIVNDDTPVSPPGNATLTLVKQVVNDDGGSAEAEDWTLSADGPDEISGETGSADVTDAPVTPGDYDLGEDGPDGYTTDGWTCDGGTLDGDTVTLEDGDDVTCTIVNDDTGPTPPSPPVPSPSPTASDDGTSVPTAVASGESGPGDGGGSAGLLATGLTLLGAGAALLLAQRRRGAH